MCFLACTKEFKDVMVSSIIIIIINHLFFYFLPWHMNTIRTWLHTFEKFSPCPLMWSNSSKKNNSEEPFRTQVQKNICKLPNSPINRAGLLVKIAGSICDLILPISHHLSKRIILSVSNRCVCKLTVFCFIFSLRKWAEISVLKGGMTNNRSTYAHLLLMILLRSLCSIFVLTTPWTPYSVVAVPVLDLVVVPLQVEPRQLGGGWKTERRKRKKKLEPKMRSSMQLFQLLLWLLP